jgi:NADPH:quinone reductase-like Zn-dependent oxidoreductase
MWQKIRNPFSRQEFLTFVMKYRKDDLNWVIQQVQSGLLTIPMDSVFPLEKAQQSHVRLESGRATGKILLEVGE